MTSLVPSAGQAAALDMVAKFLSQSKERVAVITGYAGVGKSTAIRMIADRFGEPSVFTPTGKAALRVAEATGIFAMTIHRFLYRPSEDSRTGEPVFTLRDSWDEVFTAMEGKLVLIDEASMVSVEVWGDLLRTAQRIGFHIILMGDLFQLPPIQKDKSGTPFSTLNYHTPFNINLTEIIRQALDSPIIRASMLLRTGKPEYEAMALLNPVGANRLIEAVIEGRKRGGATLCFTNARRHDINNRVRGALGYEQGTVMKDEPLLVVQNNYDLNVYNGELVDFQGWATDPCEPFVITDRYTSSSLNIRLGVSTMSDKKTTVCPEQVTGVTETAKIGPWVIRKTARGWYKHRFDVSDAVSHMDANYGYCSTCHKLQGSEFSEVLVIFDESMGMLQGRERARWVYTSLTRAKKTVNYVYLKDRV